MESAPLWRIGKDSVEPIMDFLIAEGSLDIFLNDEFLTNLKCLPNEPVPLAVGFLVTEGFLVHPSEMTGVRTENNGLSVHVDIQVPAHRFKTAQRLLRKFPGIDPVDLFRQASRNLNLEIPAVREPMATPADILALFDDFRKKSETFQKLGSVHSAGLSNGTELIRYAEDISRHNAVDRVIGGAFLQDLDLSRLILMTTGRMPCDMITKVVMSRIPFCVARSAPTAPALRLAREFGLTLCGRAGAKRMTVFCGSERLTGLTTPFPEPNI